MRVAAVFLLLLVPPAFAQVATASFLRVPVGARPVALGGAYTAMAEDPYAMHFNPAGLARSPRQVVASHNEYILDMQQEYIAYAHPLNVGAIGVSVNYFDLGMTDGATIPNIASPVPPISSSIRDTDVSNFAVSIGYGRELFMEGLNVGIAAKYIDQIVGRFRDNTFAFDLGVYYHRENNPLSVGFAILNLGDKLRLQSINQDLPRTLRLGGAYRIIPDKLIVTADAERTIHEDRTYSHLGAEYWVVKMLALRIGWDKVSEAGNGLRLGLGAKWKGLSFDYAYADENELKDVHRVSAGYSF